MKLTTVSRLRGRRSLGLSAPARSVSPGSPRVSPSGTQQFTAAHFTGGAVTWSAVSGSITVGGLYTAPASAGLDTVTATGVSVGTETATAAVTVHAPNRPRWFPGLSHRR